MEALVGTLVGAVVAIATTITVEALRRPTIYVGLGTARDKTYEDKPAKSVRFLTLSVRNASLPAFARWMSRNAATQCHGMVSFHHLDGQDVFGRSMALRWTGSTEPIAPTVEINGTRLALIDQERLNSLSRRDIAAGEVYSVDIAAKFDSDEECFGWNNEAYLCNPPWRNPRWRLGPGRYILRVDLRTSGRHFTAYYRLCNEGPRDAFRIESSIPGDREKVDSRMDGV